MCPAKIVLRFNHDTVREDWRTRFGHTFEPPGHGSRTFSSLPHSPEFLIRDVQAGRSRSTHTAAASYRSIDGWMYPSLWDFSLFLFFMHCACTVAANSQSGKGGQKSRHCQAVECLLGSKAKSPGTYSSPVDSIATRRQRPADYWV